MPSLFSAIDPTTMTDETIAELVQVCIGIVPKLDPDNAHREEYGELRARLEGEQRRRERLVAEQNRAATAIQSAIRGKLERDKLEKEKEKVLAQKNAAATALQSAIRGKLERDRLEEELAKRNSAATTLQSAIRGKLERDRLKEEQLLRERTKAALTLQSIFRMQQGRTNLDDLRELKAEADKKELERKTAEDLARKQQKEAEDRSRRIGLADAKLETVEAVKIDPAKIQEAVRVNLGQLLEVYSSAEAGARGKRGRDPENKERLKQAGSSLQAALNSIIAAIQSDLLKGKEAKEALLALTYPTGFQPEGVRDFNNFSFPRGARWTIGNKAYQFHPNRAMIHVKDEIEEGADRDTGQRYLNSLLASCNLVVTGKAADYKVAPRPKDPKDAVRYAIPAVNGTKKVVWNILFKVTNPKVTGYNGEIFHIDSGYEKSGWLAKAKSGK